MEGCSLKEEQRAPSEQPKDLTNPLALELQQVKVELSMHKVALKQAQQIQTLEKQARETAKQSAALESQTKALEAKIQDQITSNAAMAQTFRAQNVSRKNQTDERVLKLSKSFATMKQFLIDRHRLIVVEEASQTATTELQIIFSRLEQNAGLGAVLLWDNSSNLIPCRPLSRRVTEGESKLSPLEGEALAIKWGLEELRSDILGANRLQVKFNFPV